MGTYFCEHYRIQEQEFHLYWQARYRARWDSIFEAASSNLFGKKLFRGRFFCNPHAVNIDCEDTPSICTSCYDLVKGWICHLSKLESSTDLKSQLRGWIDGEVIGTGGILCTTCARYTTCVFVPDVSSDLGRDMDLIPGLSQFLEKK